MSDTKTEAPTAVTGRWPVIAWGLWDWGSAAFNAVITTFVFSVYITSDSFGSGASAKLGWALATAGVLIALFAPITGRRADSSGRRTFWLTVNTALVIVASVGLFFVKPSPDYLWLGLVLLAAGNIFFEFASVQYNAMLNDISTPDNVGRISGFGWGLGYLGGIVLLLIVFYGFIDPEVGLFGVTDKNGLDVRVTMLLCALWTLVFSLPVILTMRDDKAARQPRGQSVSVIESYRQLFGTIRDLWNTDRNTAYFLMASAVFRDGLAGVFTFGGVLAAGTFGFTPSEVIIFAVAANVVAGIATIASGTFDDWLGPKPVIVGSLTCMLVAGSTIFFLHDRGATIFWTFGLLLCVFVGPAQSASRTFLARLIPEGKEGEIFGLYATTGRAVSFMAPAAWSGFIVLGAAVTGVADKDSAEHWGILGIMLVLGLGLALLTLVRSGENPRSALGS
ncbi:MFS transporter [Nocardioides jishulii]|uniref:MFS transporter n=1 Tax=Nocardioides jishulii TaxID=2575440 RepID=A0A4V5TM95_9ACTN|nr:MFS transporter [Nocardioides jishulii]QCX27566.1 MFS transporter [Nocardioides jishulii]TKI62373.1 MFS transporter [Nocardioides jishulii]